MLVNVNEQQLGLISLIEATGTEEDLDALVAIERAAFDSSQFEGAAASKDQIAQRLRLLSPGNWIAIAYEKGGTPIGSVMLMPVNVELGTVKTWAQITNDGQITDQCISTDGGVIYVVSLGTIRGHPLQDFAEAALVEWLLTRWRKHQITKKHPVRLMFSASMPGYVKRKNQMSPEEYAFWVDDLGQPVDPVLKGYYLASVRVGLFGEDSKSPQGHWQMEFIENGYPPDKASSGHALCVTIQDPAEACTAFRENLLVILGNLGRRRVPLSDHQIGWEEHMGIPFGCPEHRGVGDNADLTKCTFCALSTIVDHLAIFLHGKARFTNKQVIDHVNLMIAYYLFVGQEVNSLAFFNAGSFPQMAKGIQQACLDGAIHLKSLGLREIIIESRADRNLLTKNRLAFLEKMAASLSQEGIKMIVRIGVESIEEHRNKVLGKGHTDEDLKWAVDQFTAIGIDPHAYVLVNPGPKQLTFVCNEEGQPVKPLQVLDATPLTDEEQIDYAVTTCRTVAEMGFKGVILNFTFPPGDEANLQYQLYKAGSFAPPTFFVVFTVLQMIQDLFGEEKMALQVGEQSDEPAPAATSSFRSRDGIPGGTRRKDLCPEDSKFQGTLDRFRRTLDWSCLTLPGDVMDSLPDWWQTYNS